MRGLQRVFVVGFTVTSLMIVAAVGVSAASGPTRSAHAFDSVAALVSGHFDLTGTHTEGNRNEGNGNGNDRCPPPNKHHKHHTGGHEHHPCGDESGEDDSG